MLAARFGLSGKVAIVTGGGRGIGRAIATGFAEAGATVVLTSRTQAELDTAAQEITDAGGRAEAVACDVTQADQIDSLAARVVADLGRIDILVNNAGAGCPPVPFFELPEKTREFFLATNLKSVFLCCQRCGRAMAKTGGGSIINIGSVMGLGPHPLRAPYSAAKAGLFALTRTLSVELAPFGLRVNAIAPGFIEVERLWKQFPDYGRTVRPARLAQVPAGRMGAPQDVADAAIFLASDASGYITGQVLRVDGGLTTTVFPKTDQTQGRWW